MGRREQGGYDAQRQRGYDAQRQGGYNAPRQAQHSNQPPYGQAPPGAAPHGAAPPGWQQGTPGEPEYFGGQQHGRHGPGPGGPDSYAANNSGHTQSFSVGDAANPGYPPYGDGYDDGYGDQGGYGQSHAYTAGQPSAPPIGPRLHWKQLLSGIVLRPNATFWQMRDHTVWGPAIVVTFLYGLLAVFGFGQAREDVLNATLSNSIPYVLTSGVALCLSSLVLGAVTHTLARQFGGVGAWGPTIGLSMLIMAITDAPRLLFALFLGGDAPFVQVLGWVTWLAAGALFTLMVSRSHDLPWYRALGACSIQLIALLALLKLGTL